ncbi:hypothetical protein Tco_0557358 [Tanacetum coccineum]
MSSYNHPGCSCCGGPFNGGNCPSCSSVGSGNEFVYDPNPYSYNETPSFFNQPPQHQYETYSCEFCGNIAHYGYDCPPQVPFVYNQDPCFNQNFDNFPQTSPSFQQQYLGCENCGGPHENFHCQPLNQNFYEPNHYYNYNSFGFDQSQPLQFPVIHQPPHETSVEILQARENLIKQHQPDDIQDLLHKLLKDVQVISEELADYINTPNWNRPAFYEDDDEEYTIAITPVLPTEEPDNSLSMGDEHLSTIPETESDEFIKSSVENLIQNPREFKDECECDVPDCDDSQTTNFSTFSNPLFDDSTSSDDESSHEEVIHKMSFKTYSNPLFDLDEEIISSKFNPIHNEDLDSTPKNDRFDTESYLLESLLNRDTLMASSPKIDPLLDEFAGELITIPPRIVNREHEEYISIMERLLYDNSSPRPPKDFHVNPNTIIESLPTFSIPVEDSNSLREEIDIFPGPYDSIPQDSTIDVVEDIPVDVPNIFPTHPILHMDFDFIPSHNDLGSDLDVSSPSEDRNKIYDPRICIEVESTRFLTTLSPMIDTLLPFSFENEDKVFNHGVLASKEKSPPSLSHQGFKASKIFHHKSPMLIYGDDIPILDVPFLHFYPP